MQWNPPVVEHDRGEEDEHEGDRPEDGRHPRMRRRERGGADHVALVGGGRMIKGGGRGGGGGGGGGVGRLHHEEGFPLAGSGADGVDGRNPERVPAARSHPGHQQHQLQGARRRRGGGRGEGCEVRRGDGDVGLDFVGPDFVRPAQVRVVRTQDGDLQRREKIY